MLNGLSAPSFSSRHSITVSASAQQCYTCLRHIDIGRGLGMRVLLATRGLRHLRTLKDAIRVGFVIVDDQEPRHIILGLVGQPWRPSGNLQRLPAAELLDFDEPGFVKVLWNFTFDETPEGCRVRTSTEIYATDRRAHRSFGRYWWLVKPFSGMLRRSMLRSIKQCAEA